MTTRMTRSDADAALERLCKALGARKAESWNDVGGLQLDYNPTYGGVYVEQIYNDAGAVTNPLGSRRMTLQEFYYAVRFALDALLLKEQIEEEKFLEQVSA